MSAQPKMSSARARMLTRIEELLTEATTIEERIDAAPPWRWLLRERLESKLNRILNQAEFLMRQHDRRWPRGGS